MKQRPPHTPNPNSDAIDRLLDAHLAADSVDLAPSSGFAASVMESINAEASEPPPIAFPWRRVLPGAIAIFCGLLAFIVFAIREAGATPNAAQSSSIAPWPNLAVALALTPRELALGWILLAAFVSIAVVAASIRLTGRSE